MDRPDRRASRWLRRLAWAVVLGGVAVFAVAVVVRAGKSEQVPWLDIWVYGIVYVATGLLLTLQRSASPWSRWGWRSLGLALFFNAAGNVYFSLVVEHAPEPVYPSAADYLYLIWYALAYVGILLLIRANLPRLNAGLALDAVITGLGSAAVVVALTLGDVIAIEGATTQEILVNLAYPVADLLLIFILVAGASMMGPRMGPTELLLGAGLALTAAADVAFLMQDAADEYVEGGWVDLLWLLGVIGILAAHEVGRGGPRSWPGRGRAGLARRVERPGWAADLRSATEGLALPMTSALMSEALIGAHHAGLVPEEAVILADVCVLVAVLRGGLSFREVRKAKAREVSILHRQARTDELTGLPNRRALYESCDGLLAEATGDRPVWLLLLDLDRFKEINDALGHSLGDDLLREVAERVRGLLTSSEALARLGGDEFAILGPGSVEDARERAEKVLNSLAVPFVLAGTKLHVEGSIGIACAPDHAVGRSELLQFADVAMYEAKRSRGRIGVYASGSGVTGWERLRLAEELRGALAGEEPRRNGHLLVHLQPQLTLDERQEVVGAEALVRWAHPQRGLLLPGEFLPLARGAGMFDAVVGAVLDLALGACRQWWEAGWRVPVSVNASASDLRNPAVVEQVAEALARHGLPAEALVVEVTEETLMIDPGGAHMVLERLRGLGARVSIDDFGAGYSSFAYLRSIPADELKLDALFIQDLAREPTPGSRPATIVRMVADLAHALGLRLVTEGIEDGRVAALLHLLGADVGQGYHLGRPMPLGDLLSWFSRQGSRDLSGSSPGGQRHW